MTRILVTDDEPSMRQGLADNLEFEGYKVDMAANGMEALDLLSKEPYDLLILDVMMPELSGFDVCKKLRQQIFQFLQLFFRRIEGIYFKQLQLEGAQFGCG